ncbi:MAG TPA: alpha/beta hydrolase [Thermohalobaculum sp.]|nr:alpha/beta hydrolase [Thermohalobaculum sp.]
MEAAQPRPVDLPPGGRAWDATLALTASDGVRLRGAVWRHDGRGRGHAIVLQGRTEFLEKYAGPAAGLVARGFAVASLDWRGQGHSDRLVANPLKGHVGRFTDYHRDLQALLAHPEVAGLAGPRLVLAHSMGGTIGLGAVLRGVMRPAALIVLAPMLGIAMSKGQRLLCRLLLPLARALGRPDIWPPLAGAAAPYVLSGFEGNVLTDDRARFAWMVEALRRDPALGLGMPTLGWFDAALAEADWIARHGPLEVPGLCLLGSDEAVVGPAAVRAGAPRLGLELVEIAGARHELLISSEPVRRATWEAIDRFLAARGL